MKGREMSKQMNHFLYRSILLVILVSAGAAYGFNPNADESLKGWWKLDDGTGTVAIDSSGNGHDGTLMGGPTWAAGYYGGALDFDGTDDYVDTHWTENLATWTISCWAKSPAAPSGSGQPSGPLHREGNYQINWNHSGGWAGYVGVNIGGAWTGTTLGTLQANTWYFLCGTYDGTDLKAYTNGVLASSVNAPGTPSAESNSMKLGRHAASAQYYTGLVDDARVYNRALTLEEIQLVMGGGFSPGLATNPDPGDSATDVPWDTDLSWTPGKFAATHDVYFGTSAEDVNSASAANPLSVLVSPGQTAASYDPPGKLTLGQTYYWRIDEVNAPPDSGMYKGEIWSFTVEPFSYPVSGVTATASGQGKPTVGPEKTVDGSGLNANDEHGTLAEDEWLSAQGPSAWIQYDLGKVYKVDRMMVWNANQALESLFGFGAKDVTAEYSTDGENWTTLGDYEFARAPGSPDYVGDTIVDFAGVPVRYVKLTITSNWGGLFKQYGLSEVRFYYIPVAAREPNPEPNATDVDPRMPLSWRAGREAASHDVYVDADPNAVADGAVAPVTVTQPQCDADLNLDATYCWKVVEINQAETYSTWGSDVWSFSTAHYISIDDFESYNNNSPNRVFQAWIDGGGFSADAFFPNGNPGNGTGSFAGYDPQYGDIMEFVNVFDGGQSMPLYYDNGASPNISEAQRTFATPQDWTRHGVTALVLFFYGDPANSPAPLYVKLNDTKVVYNNGAVATTKAMWQQWNIPLVSVAGLNLQSIKSITIGIGDGAAGGTGTIFIDAVRLYAAPPEVPIPTDPGTNGLAALYAMEGNVQDSSGKNLHATANGEPGYVDGPAGMGQALAFDGVNDYVDLPIGDLVSTMESGTFAGWVDYANAGGDWQRIFDFSISTQINMFMTPDAGNNRLRFAITTGGSSATAEQRVNGPRTFPPGWHHVAVVIDSAAMTLTLYQDGTPVDSQPTTLLPKDLGVTTSNWLGRSVYTADAYFNGSIDEFRIYDRALSEGEIRYLAGDR